MTCQRQTKVRLVPTEREVRPGINRHDQLPRYEIWITQVSRRLGFRSVYRPLNLFDDIIKGAFRLAFLFRGFLLAFLFRGFRRSLFSHQGWQRLSGGCVFRMSLSALRWSDKAD